MKRVLIAWAMIMAVVSGAFAAEPGAFGQYTTFNMLNWVVEKGYDGDESFQRYHARKFAEQTQ